MTKPTLKVTSDFTKEFNEIVGHFKSDEVLVGIPEDTSQRKDSEDSSINNAALLAINEFGSPANNIPARPVMQIGIEAAQDKIADEFEKAAKAALSKGFTAVDDYYNRAGIVASQSVKKVINDQIGIDPPAAATLKNRQARGFKGTKALVVTGQLRNSITWVLNKVRRG